MLTLRERWMLAFMNQVTDKSNWTRKVFDDDIIARWKKEATTTSWNKKRGGYRYVCEYDDMDEYRGQKEPMDVFTEVIFEYVRHSFLQSDMGYKLTYPQCIQELRDKAAIYEEHSIIPVLDSSSCVLKSDKAIPARLKENLKQAVARLEDISDKEKDWRPDSDNSVLDLVHPSLFPLVYGQSRVLVSSTVNLENCLQNAGGGIIVPVPGKYTEEKFWSRRFQWLPCNVSFPDGEYAKIDSYINNLHPRDHRDLYLVLEKFIDHAMPFWNIIIRSRYPIEDTDLSKGSDPSEGGNPSEGDDLGKSHDTNDTPSIYPRIGNSLMDYVQKRDCYDDSEEENEDKDEDEDEEDRIIDLGTPGIYQGPNFKSEHFENKFAFLGNSEKKIQVIFKLTNIMLTPDRPEYKACLPITLKFGWLAAG